MVMVSFVGQTVVRGALTTFLAVLAIEVLGMGDAGVGVLGAAIGLGGIVGAFGALGIGAERRLALVFAIALVGWGAPIAVIGFVPVTVVAIVALAVVGIANALIDVSGLTLLQRGTSNAGALRRVRGARGRRQRRGLDRRHPRVGADRGHRHRAGPRPDRPPPAGGRRRRLAAGPAARHRGRGPRAPVVAAAPDPAVLDAPAGRARARRRAGCTRCASRRASG